MPYGGGERNDPEAASTFWPPNPLPMFRNKHATESVLRQRRGRNQKTRLLSDVPKSCLIRENSCPRQVRP
jgi:hypothetical protein